MTIEEIKNRKNQLHWTNADLARYAGLPISTVAKILGGSTRNPRQNTIEAMTQALEKAPEKGFHIYTATEREAFPDSVRTEIIDGILYNMSAPTTIHQDICRMVCRQIEDCIINSRSLCRVYMAPTDVFIDRDEYTVVQPDVFIVCDTEKITEKNIQGAPDFILEVTSPSTRRIDMYEKLRKYELSGVREYWIIDPDSMKIIVYDMRRDNPDSCSTTIGLFGFTDTIPLLISDGKCGIDMTPIYRQLQSLYKFK